jgi:hypothetical protein
MPTPYKQILALDFETKWDSKSYTLSKMTNEEYIRDRRFGVWGAALHIVGSPDTPRWVGYTHLKRVFNDIDWSTTAVLAHNAQFDVSILSWVYGHQPCFIFDTLSMARALRGIEVGNSLAKLADEFGLPPKGQAVHSTDGMMGTLSLEVEKELAEYCKHDVFLCEEIFKRLSDGYPVRELRVIDMTLRMYTRPLLRLDDEMLQHALTEEREEREALLSMLGVPETALASDQQFAEVLRMMGVEPPTKPKRPTKKTPNPVGRTFAFAKNDAMFQAMLHGENADVALLCETRLRVKSTTERTRAQRFLEIANRGTLPFPVAYYGAKTGRFSAAKGAAINMQNLKRGSFLRKAIMAPPEHVLVVGDLSQIEPRVLAWQADYEEMLDIFRSKKDPYAMFGAQMFGIPGLTKDSHPSLRQSAKSALLGCFGADTPVLTKRGWVPIVQVQATDTVWDGKEWVCHQGVVPQGEKEVLTALGISATSDHEILTEHGWAAWSEVLANRSLLTSALSSANLPVQAGVNATARITQPCGALAVGKASLIARTYWPEGAPAAEAVLTPKQSKHAMPRWGTPSFAQKESTAKDYSTASVPSLSGAPTLKVASIQTMAGAVSRYTLRGLKTAWSFCATLLASTVGISPRCNWIASTTTGATFPVTFDSSHAASTWPTSAASRPEKSSSSGDASKPLKQKMQTYDIAYAGPRNRYTILTSEGPLVVHNCGYGLGWASFAGQLLVGFLGAPPVRYDKAFAKQLGVTRDYINRFLDWAPNLEQMAAIPRTCTTDELLIHCVSAKKIIDIYRATAHPVVGLWELYDKLIERSLFGGEEYTHKCLVFRKEEIVMPNGMSLKYPNLRKQVATKNGKKNIEWVYGENTKLYAGKITNNTTQGLARIIMTDGMLRVSKRYPVAGTVHDEQLAVAHESEKDEALPWVLEQMTKAPKYMPDIPLAADGGVHQRYGLAKQ